MLKLPEALRAQFRAYGAAAVRAIDVTLSPEAWSKSAAEISSGVEMVREVIAARRVAPLPDDFLSTLIAARDQDAKLSETEMISFVQTLITAGSETTIHAICFAIYTLLQHPDQRKQVTEDPSLTRNAVEETLRYNRFTKTGVPKLCTEEMDFAGIRLRKGQMVYGFLSAALRDPKVFPDPDRFDIHRDLSQTIAFGSGAHFCLGATLARMELEIATRTLLQRFPGLRLSERPEFEPHPVVRSMKRLLVRGCRLPGSAVG
jgi:cytochrome P450